MSDEVKTEEKSDVSPPVDTDTEKDAPSDEKTEEAKPETVTVAEKKSRVPVTRIDEEAVILLEEAGPGSEKPVTVFDFYEGRVKQYTNTYALCAKKDGNWVQWTYEDYFRDVVRTAKGFIKLGLEPFHAVGIIGFNAPEWIFSQLGAIYAGGVASGMYTTNSPEACKYILEDCKANIVVCENDNQVQKMLKVRDELPHLKAIVQYKGELKEKHDGLYTWEELLKEGESIEDKVIDERKSVAKPGNCCTLVYTSGTTGNPKGVMLSHDNITWTAITAVQKRFAEAGYLNTGDCNIVSYLPLSHVAAMIIDVFGSIAIGATVYFAQPDALKGSLKVTLGEARPHMFFGVPRVWEKFQEAIEKNVSEASSLRQSLFRWSSDKVLRGNMSLEKGESTPWGYTAGKFLLRKIRKALGLDRCALALSGAAPLSAKTYEFFQSINLTVGQVYGMSENSGPHTVTMPGKGRAGKCGQLFSEGVKTKFADPDDQGDGEVCMYGRHVFMGYNGMEEKSKEALDEDGWLHSGDIGNMDQDGYLSITGRIKELIITAGGENVAPVPIEDKIKAHLPFVSNIMLIGDKKKFLSCLFTLKVVIDPDTGVPGDDLQVGAHEALKQLGCTATKCSEIIATQDKNVFGKIQSAIDHYNEEGAVSRAQKVQKWTLLSGDFSIPGGELGPTLKLRRSVTVKKYQETIDALYEES